MRPVIITANWKMNTTPADAGPLAADIAKATDVANVTRIICPPYTNITAVSDAVEGTGMLVGAQNVHAEAKGAYTGEIAPAKRAEDIAEHAQHILTGNPLGLTAEQVLLGDHFENGPDILSHAAVDENDRRSALVAPIGVVEPQELVHKRLTT